MKEGPERAPSSRLGTAAGGPPAPALPLCGFKPARRRKPSSNRPGRRSSPAPEGEVRRPGRRAVGAPRMARPMRRYACRWPLPALHLSRAHPGALLVSGTGPFQAGSSPVSGDDRARRWRSEAGSAGRVRRRGTAAPLGGRPAEGVGFEPTVRLPPQRFSRPSDSAACGPFRRTKAQVRTLLLVGVAALRIRSHPIRTPPPFAPPRVRCRPPQAVVTLCARQAQVGQTGDFAPGRSRFVGVRPSSTGPDNTHHPISDDRYWPGGGRP